VSPLAPASQPVLPEIAGVRLAGAAVGLEKNGGRDLMPAELAQGSTGAATRPRSLRPSPPVGWCRTAPKGGPARAFVFNAGNANAFTGNAGDKTVAATVKAAAKLFGCKPGEVFVASTGVIGQPVPPNHIAGALPKLKKALRRAGWNDAAEAIRTT